MSVISTVGKVYGLSRVPESAYGVAVAAANGAGKAHHQVLLKKADNPVKVEVRTKNNQEFATGSNFATRQYTTEHDGNFNFNIDLDSFSLGLLLHSALGSIVSTAPYAGAAAVKKHVYKPYDPKVTAQLPSRTLLEFLAVGEDRVFPGGVVQSLELKGDGSGTIEASVTIITAGSIIKPSLHNVDWADTANVTVIKLSNVNPFFENPQARIILSDVATQANPINIGCTLRNWSIKIENKLLAELGYQPGCSGNYFDPLDPTQGIVRTRLLSEGQDIMLKYQVELGAQDYLNYLSTQRPFDFVQTLGTRKLIATGTGPVDYYHNASFRAFNTQIKSVDRSAPNNILIADIEPMILDDGSGIFQAIVENETASYLV
jgi:hypothetical protein